MPIPRVVGRVVNLAATRRFTRRDARARPSDETAPECGSRHGALLGQRNLRNDAQQLLLPAQHGPLARGANLRGAVLTHTRLTRVYLHGADLTGADLTGADLSGADLTDADLTRVYLIRADLHGANLTTADLHGADLTDALMEPDAVIPPGWQRDTDSGRLKRADTSSGGTTS